MVNHHGRPHKIGPEVEDSAGEGVIQVKSAEGTMYTQEVSMVKDLKFDLVSRHETVQVYR